jgi:hypothetical protein
MAFINRDVHNSVSARLVAPFLDGYNVALFCYGQTGSGKTHTVFGSEQDPKGIVFHTVNQICAMCEAQTDRRFLLRLEVVEIYNEEVRDLMHPDKPKLVIVDHPLKGSMCAGSTERFVHDPKDAFEVIAAGVARRAMRPTKMNANSSRSHAIVRFSLESRPTDPNETPGMVKLGDVCQWVKEARR